jgi:hypothetical protein
MEIVDGDIPSLPRLAGERKTDSKHAAVGNDHRHLQK